MLTAGILFPAPQIRTFGFMPRCELTLRWAPDDVGGLRRRAAPGCSAVFVSQLLRGLRCLRCLAGGG